MLIRHLECVRCSRSSGCSGCPCHSFDISFLLPEFVLLQRIGNSLLEIFGVEEPFVDLLCLFVVSGCEFI